MSVKKVEAEAKFKKTKDGRKLLKKSIIWTILLLICVITEFLLFNSGNEGLIFISDLLSPITWIFLGIGLYYDGKYQGALEMYNKRLK